MTGEIASQQIDPFIFTAEAEAVAEAATASASNQQGAKEQPKEIQMHNSRL